MSTCLNCGKKVSNMARRCPYCGHDVDKEWGELFLFIIGCAIAPSLLIIGLINYLIELPVLINWIIGIFTCYYWLSKCRNLKIIFYVGIGCLILGLIINGCLDRELDIVSPLIGRWE